MTNVLKDGGAKQDGFLTHQSHFRAQEFHIEITDVVPIKQDIALDWVVESFQELEDRRFPRARRANNCCKFVLWDLNVDVLQYNDFDEQ